MDRISKGKLLDMLRVEELKELAYSLDLDDRGNKAYLITTLIKVPIKQILELCTVEELKFICGNLDLPAGKKAAMMESVAGTVDESLIDITAGHALTDRVNLVDPTIENVVENLRQAILARRQIKTEKDAEEAISHRLLNYYRDVMTQYNLGGMLGLKIDIDINDGKFGIEVKLVDSLLKNSSEIFRMIGQAVYYTKKRYGSNFILAVVGTSDDLDEPVVREAFSFLETIGMHIVPVVME
jgi:hypothetical protein